MLYDDDRSGSPFEPISPHDDRVWNAPVVSAADVRRFDGADRVLFVLGAAGGSGSYLVDKILGAAGMDADPDTIREVICPLLVAGLVSTQEWDDGLYISISEYGMERVSELIGYS
jgi:hypothetical protein